MFNCLHTTRKGTIAERYVRDVLISKGWHIYTYAAEQSHPVDMIAITPDNRLVAVEVKCKSARIYYTDTGIDRNDYYAYHNLQTQLNLPVLLLFVDNNNQSVYGNYLDHLSQPITIVYNNRELTYPLFHKRQVYFALQTMQHYAYVPADIVAELNSHTASNYYNPSANKV